MNVIRAILALILFASFNSAAFAKRSAPAEVAPIIHAGIEYRAPTGRMGYIEAHQAKGGKLLWSRQIYVVIFDQDMEKDVQDTFISAMKVDGNELAITNERGFEYRLDLATLEVKAVKGTVAVRIKT